MFCFLLFGHFVLFEVGCFVGLVFVGFFFFVVSFFLIALLRCTKLQITTSNTEMQDPIAEQASSAKAPKLYQSSTEGEGCRAQFSPVRLP